MGLGHFSRRVVLGLGLVILMGGLGLVILMGGLVILVRGLGWVILVGGFLGGPIEILRRVLVSVWREINARMMISSRDILGILGRIANTLGRVLGGVMGGVIPGVLGGVITSILGVVITGILGVGLVTGGIAILGDVLGIVLLWGVL